jgi:hydrogenase 3 maturation protease
MSSPSWLDYLIQSLKKRQQEPDQQPRVAVVGFGQEFNGDDAAGIVVARGLQSRLSGQDRLLVIDAGPAPENHTGALRQFSPDLVLLIDAAQMGDPPGTVRWLNWQDTTGISASTHTLPPYMLAQYLTSEFGCEVALIGIQPLSNEMDAPLSPIMQQAVEVVIEGLVRELS